MEGITINIVALNNLNTAIGNMQAAATKEKPGKTRACKLTGYARIK